MMKPHAQDLLEAISLVNSLAPEARGTSGPLKDAYELAKRKANQAATDYVAIENMPHTRPEGT
jgi:hypothetical protein